MDCLLHQVLVAMLTVTPAGEAPHAAKAGEIRPRAAAAAAPAPADRPAVRLGKKTRGGPQVAQVTLPRATVN